MASNNVEVDEKQVYLCSSCGGGMKFDIKTQKLVCEYCGTEGESETEEKGITEYDLESYMDEGKVGNWKSEVRVMTCEGCGAEIVINSEETAKDCSFCGSSHITAGHENAGIKPEGILPFKIDSYRANEKLEKWMKTRFLSPGDLKNIYSSEKIKAIYVPYWTFDANTSSYYTGQGGKNYYETVEIDGKEVKKKRTNWYSVSGRVNLFFDDIQVNASKNFSEVIINNVEPFSMEKLVPYNKKYLSGYVAERYTKGIKVCFGIAKLEMRNKIRNKAKTQILQRYDEAKITNLDVRYNNCKFKHILVPVWTANYDYNGKKYKYVINGETGKVSGTVPYSIAKIIALVIVISVIAGIVIYMGRN